MADAFLLLPAEDRREALSIAADRSGRPAHLLEKDVWVVWALATLYGSLLGEHLLKQELGMEKVVHYVVSRFPVIGADPAVINYNQIDRLRFAGQEGA